MHTCMPCVPIVETVVSNVHLFIKLSCIVLPIYTWIGSQPTELPWWLSGLERRSYWLEIAGSNPTQGSSALLFEIS